MISLGKMSDQTMKEDKIILPKSYVLLGQCLTKNVHWIWNSNLVYKTSTFVTCRYQYYRHSCTCVVNDELATREVWNELFGGRFMRVHKGACWCCHLVLVSQISRTTHLSQNKLRLRNIDYTELSNSSRIMQCQNTKRCISEPSLA